MTLSFDQDERTGRVRLREPVQLPMPLGLTDYTVPAGYVSDGQSAPRGLWWLVGPPLMSPYLRCWIGHDWACDVAGCWAERAVADALLAYWLLRAGAGRVKAIATFWACFTWGRWAFLRRDGWK